MTFRRITHAAQYPTRKLPAYQLLLGAVGLAITGCTPLIEGFQQGIEEGTTEALSSLLEAPVDYFISQVFGSSEG